MKHISIIGIIICIISLLIMLFLNGFFINFILLALLLISLMGVIKKDVVKYMLSFLGVSYFSIYVLTLIGKSNILFAMYLVGYILYLLGGFSYVLDKFQNKHKLKFDNIVIPKTNYLAIKYIDGFKCKSGNAIITKDDIIYKFMVETKENVYEYGILKNKIENIKIVEKPHIYQKNVVKNKEYDYSRQYITGTTHIIPESVIRENTIKIIRSYDVNIILKNGQIIHFITFNNPNRFFEIK